MMSEMPLVNVAQPLQAVHIAFGLVFIAGYFAMKLGLYRKTPWLYVKLLNATQPYRKTILINKNS
jgi:NAD(P)H-quinone oxidoreductase subunit 5